MAELQDYKCPNCNGNMEFDTKSGKMKCPFCETILDIPVASQDTQTSETLSWDTTSKTINESEGKSLGVYSCQSCGGEIVGDETTAATSCPYCGNHVVIKGQFAGNLRPDLIIPFKLDKKAAKEALKNHMKGKVLLPKCFSDENHIDEIKALYVPFWLFSGDAKGDIHYKCSKVTNAWSDGNYNYTEISHYRVERGGSVSFAQIPADGSSKMPDDLMGAIEPFEVSEAVAFNLAGFLADKYDVPSEKCTEHINKRVIESVQEIFSETVQNYDTSSIENCMVNMENSSVQYALYPVWLLNTSWKGKCYLFAMNGQTGKMVGDLPMDESAYWKRFSIMAVVFSVIAYFILRAVL